MEKIKPTLSFGYPLKIYQFTGEYQGVLQGFSEPIREKRIVFAPIYRDYEGKGLIDMSQLREEGEIWQINILR